MFQSTLPLYVQIANNLRQKIQQEVYQAGDKLPSQKELGNQFGVNRHTVRQALELLKDEGLLRVDRGLGAFIADAPMHDPMGQRVRYNESLQAQGHTSEHRLLSATEVPADEKIAEHLDIVMGESAIQVEFLGLADNRPLIVTTRYFPTQRCPNLLPHIPTAQSLSRLMREVYGYEHVRQQTSVSTRMVRSADAKLLQVSLNQPILLVQATNVNQHTEVIEYTVTRFRGDGVELVFASA
ncbi:MAG: phosphonate metabolism transcriptional regulator PhnF [Cyanobacteria bacterium J06638_20]